jgi:hypothetical protein
MKRTFLADGIDQNATTDFSPFNTTIDPIQNLDQSPFYSSQAEGTVTQSGLMNHVWYAAQAEWKGWFGVPAGP